MIDVDDGVAMELVDEVTFALEVVLEMTLLVLDATSEVELAVAEDVAEGEIIEEVLELAGDALAEDEIEENVDDDGGLIETEV